MNSSTAEPPALPSAEARTKLQPHWTHITVKAQTPRGIKYVSGIIHRTEDRARRKMEPAYYEKNCAETGVPIPEGPHHEIQVFGGIWDENRAAKYHIHPVPGGKERYMCWTGSLPDLESARRVFEIWVVGTIFTAIYGDDFADVMKLAKGDASAFYRRMCDEFGIELIK